MDAQDCRDNALRCYRESQTLSDVNARRALLELMVKWHQLAERIEQFNGANRIDAGEGLFAPALCHSADPPFELEHHQAGAHTRH